MALISIDQYVIDFLSRLITGNLPEDGGSCPVSVINVLFGSGDVRGIVLLRLR